MLEKVYELYIKLRIEHCEGCKENWCSQRDHRCCTDLNFDDFIWTKAIEAYYGSNNVDQSTNNEGFKNNRDSDGGSL